MTNVHYVFHRAFATYCSHLMSLHFILRYVLAYVLYCDPSTPYFESYRNVIMKITAMQ